MPAAMPARKDRPQTLPAGRGGQKPPRVVPAATGEAPRRQVLVLDGFPSVRQVAVLGPNTSTANRYALGKMRKHVQERVKVEVGLQGIQPMRPPVKVTLRYVFADARHRDDGNFSLVAKPVLDGLVRSQILEGDNHARLQERVEFVKERGARRLEVVMEPA